MKVSTLLRKGASIRRNFRMNRELARERLAIATRSACAEMLEGRVLLAADVPVTLNINHILQLRNPDSVNPLGGDSGDYFAKVQIGDGPELSTEHFIDNPIESSDFNPHWFFTTNIDPNGGLVPVQIKLFDSDLTSNQTVDIEPADGDAKLDFLFDPLGGHLSGQPAGGDDADGSAQLTFDMYLSSKVTVTIPKFDEITDPDRDELTEGNGGDYTFGVKFGDYPEYGLDDNFVYDPGFIGIHYDFYTDPTVPIVPVKFTVHDFDTLPDNDTIDINHKGNQTSLVLDLDIRTLQYEEEGGGVSFPTKTSEGNTGSANRGRLYFEFTANNDSDGDGLFDFWETNGIDFNNDGITDLVLNSDPFHKDLFVEADAMTSYVPQVAALDDVVNAFAAVPNSFLNNPDGQPGITLHYQLDEKNIPNALWLAHDVHDWPIGFDTIKQNTNPSVAGGFGTVAERSDPNAANVLAAKALVYRYSIFGQKFDPKGASGTSEIGGNDFMVTLGDFSQTREKQAGTFMHELGHTLGLLHGGDQLTNYKPNYHSIMNYSWQFRHPLPANPSAAEQGYANSWRLDYSRTKFNDLDEAHLDETAGIGGDPGDFVAIGPILRGATDVLPQYVPETGPIDYNGDGDTIDTDVVRDLTFLNSSDPVNGAVPSDASPNDMLSASVDWNRLVYSFRDSPDFADGSSHTIGDEPEFSAQDYANLNNILLYANQGGDGADKITLRRNGANLEVFDNVAGIVVATRPLAQTNSVELVGVNGEDDQFTIDFKSGGYFFVSGGISVDGGTGGHDVMRVIGTGSTTGTYAPSATTFGDGSATVTSGAQTTSIAFAGLEPVEVSGMAKYAIVTPNGADVLNLAPGVGSGAQAGHVVSGTSGGIGFEPLTFFSIPDFTIDTATNDGASADDSVTMSLNFSTTGLTALHVNTGAGADTVETPASTKATISVDEGAGSDTLIFHGEAMTYALNPATLTVSSRKTLTYAGIDTLSLVTGTYRVTGTVSPSIIVNPSVNLGGTGTVLGAITNLPGGTVAPGVSGPGILTSGGVSLSASSTFKVDIKGSTPGSKHDQLRVNGAVSLGGATLAADVDYSSMLPGDAFVIIRNDGSDPVVGKFLQNNLTTLDGKKFAVDYAYDADGDGQNNDVALIRYGAALGTDPHDSSKKALFASGTTGDDLIRFVSAGSDKIRVLINGSDEGSFKPSGMLVGLGQAGNDTIKVELSSKRAWLYGGAGNDILQGSNDETLLVGGSGDDTLTAGTSKNVLIGGIGADVLTGGNGNDILIAGPTIYDVYNSANRASLNDLFGIWEKFSGGYQSTVNKLIAGHNGNAFKSTTVFNDSEIDNLIAGSGQNWYLLNTTGASVPDTSDTTSGQISTDLT